MKFCLLHTEQVKKRKPSFQRAHKLEVLRQICNWIPNFLVGRLAPETGVADRARTFSPWSHVVPLGHRKVFQADQTITSTLRFPRQQRQRGPLADLDRLAGLCAPLILGFPELLVA